MDSINYKITDERWQAVASTIHDVIGINLERHKKQLEMYIPRNEAVNLRISVLTNLQNCIIVYILIALKGFPGAIQSDYPNTAIH